VQNELAVTSRTVRRLAQPLIDPDSWLLSRNLSPLFAGANALRGALRTCPHCHWRIVWSGVVRSWRRFDGEVVTSTFHARCWRRFPEHKRVSVEK
jgi:hypothetical protein